MRFKKKIISSLYILRGSVSVLDRIKLANLISFCCYYISCHHRYIRVLFPNGVRTPSSVECPYKHKSGESEPVDISISQKKP